MTFYKLGLIYLVINFTFYYNKSDTVVQYENVEEESDSMAILKINDSITQVENEIIKSNKQRFIGKQVGLLLSDKTFSKYKDSVFIDEKPGLLSYLSLKYSNDLYLEIEVYQLEFVKPFNERRNWDIELFKKEKINEIRILYKSKVIQKIK